MAFSAASLAAEAGQYYTRTNIWYERSDKIFSTNYHKGLMIPIGTAVEVLKSDAGSIEFREKSDGAIFKIKLAKKYTNWNADEFFNRYFAKANPLDSAQFSSFSSMEKEAGKAGKIQTGMSKAAVLLAYGYPPTHRTPSTDLDTWTYWDSRYGNFLVQFKDGKVISAAH